MANASAAANDAEVRADGPSRTAVLEAMRTATDFMFDTLSNRGGFVWLYTMELEPYGELKARPSMIWVEPPGTPSVGLMLLEAYRATGGGHYLDQARKVAEALTAGQHPSGGWNYFIDFDPQGTRQYHEEFFSRCWGWQEFIKYRSNCTFDDFTTTEAARFFLRLYDVTRNREHKDVLDRALGLILRAQLDNGAWPQRYPPEAPPDYTAYATFNDGVIFDCILVLLEAHETLGDARYLNAARKGMDFYLLAQLPPPQAGWAQQYDAELKPAWGRPFEIGTVCAPETYGNVQELFHFYKVTGASKYLAPVPAALDWLESARIPNADGFTHTCFYEMDTNRPLYILQTGTTAEDVRFELTYEEDGCYPYAHRITLDVDALRREHARLLELGPEAAQREYTTEFQYRPLPKRVRGHYLALGLRNTRPGGAGAAEIIGSLDARSGWREQIELLDPFEPFTTPPRPVTAYTTGGYIARMYRLINYLDSLEP